VILAAGSSQRMGGENKLTATIGGAPLVLIAAEAALAGGAEPVVIVTGHAADDIRAAFSGRPFTFAHNPGYRDGLSTSLRTGVAALPSDIAGVAVLLADMPRVDGAIVRRLIDAFTANRGDVIVVPTAAGQRGNPIVWPARFFPALSALHGDRGGRDLLAAGRDAIVTVECGPAVRMDVDEPAALAAARDGRVDDSVRRRSPASPARG
jgi:molybdenum cofactor cytidylyltransferase